MNAITQIFKAQEALFLERMEGAVTIDGVALDKMKGDELRRLIYALINGDPVDYYEGGKRYELKPDPHQMEILEGMVQQTKFGRRIDSLCGEWRIWSTLGGNVRFTDRYNGGTYIATIATSLTK